MGDSVVNPRWRRVGGLGWLLSFMATTPILFGFQQPGAEDVPADTIPQYVGSRSCRSCHRPEMLGFAATLKGELLLEHPRTALERLGCEACHGPGSQHVEVEGRERTPGFLYFDRNDPAPVDVRNEACLQCHEGAARMNWLGGAHEARDVACTDCHLMMTVVSESGKLKRATARETCAACHLEQARRQEMSLARMPLLEGKMDCGNCHDPHGGQGEKLLAANSLNETCYACHAEKRGPFLWEHAPVVESCVNCHDPHGSRHTGMLALPMPRLCQQCHIAVEHPSTAQTPVARFVVGRQCANCHFAVHGSNHPSGIRFVR